MWTLPTLCIIFVPIFPLVRFWIYREQIETRPSKSVRIWSKIFHRITNVAFFSHGLINFLLIFNFFKKQSLFIHSYLLLIFILVEKNCRFVVTEFVKLSDEFYTGQEILRNINHQILILCLGTANITSTERWWNCSFWILFRWIFCSTVVFGAFWTLYRNGNSVRWTVPLCRSFWTHAYFHISINVMIDILTFLFFPVGF